MEIETKGNNNTGYLKIIVGCMFSGKTTELIKEYYKYKSCGGYKCLFINSKLDNRYNTKDDDINDNNNNNKTISHNGQIINSINVDNKLFDYFFLSNTNRNNNNNSIISISNFDVIFVNEGQFFDDLYKFINYTVNTLNKRVYVCGLDSDYQRKKFGCILDIIPLCDEVQKLYAICGECKIANGIFTHRINSKDDKEQTVIGGEDLYIPLCRKCYNEKNNDLLLVHHTDTTNTINDKLQYGTMTVTQHHELNNNNMSILPKSTSPSSVVVPTY